MLDEEQAGEDASLIAEEDEEDRLYALEAVQEDPTSMSVQIETPERTPMFGINITCMLRSRISRRGLTHTTRIEHHVFPSPLC